MKKFFFVVFSFVTSVALAGPRLDRVKAEIEIIDKEQTACHAKAASTVDDYDCDKNSLESSDKILNREYTAIMSELAKRFKAGDKDAQEIANRIRDVERAWIKFRDTECSAQATLMLNGSGESNIAEGCLSGETKERVIDLVELAENLGIFEVQPATN